MSGGGLSRQQAVFDRLRGAILSGAFGPGARLPASRALAEELGLARQTVVLAYERLAAEGYVRARTGAGTFVAVDLPDALPPALAAAPADAPALSRRGSALSRIPTVVTTGAPGASTLLAPGVPAPDLFPARAFARIAARILRAPSSGLAFYPDPQGLPELRAAIAAHLAATRGLVADPARIVVTGGTQQALRIAAELLLDPGDTAWVEDPGYVAGRGALIAAGIRPVAVSSDEDGLVVAEGVQRAPSAKLALVAPSHATPLGGALAIGRRLALLDWAGRAKAWVLEDDCDSEFRWEGKPLPPLASLDRGSRVIYCGTFSKTLAPALRLGFAVLPGELAVPFTRLHALADRGSGAFMQAVLARFMHEDLFAPHIRRMRTEYARRRAALLAALARHCPCVRPLAAPGGLHLVLLLPSGADEVAVVARARACDLGPAPLSAYYVGPPRQAGLVVGFASTPAALAAEAARRLAGAVGL